MNQQGKIVVITGMHRSGTSLTTSLLESSGLNIGKRLMGASPANIKGHFENLDFVNFHEKVLLSQGISTEGWTLEKNLQVQQQYVHKACLLVQENAVYSGNWGWKDPRTTLFLNFWAELLPQAKFLFVYRSPWEVVDSLYRRGDEAFYSNPNLAVKIWINYNNNILNFYKNFSERCVLLNIDNVLKNPAILSNIIKQKLDVTLAPPVASICDKSLLDIQISTSHRPGLMKHFFPEALDLYYALQANADIQPQSSTVFETLHQETRYIDWVFQDWLDIRNTERNSKFKLEHLQSQLQHTQVELQQSQSQLQHTQVELQQSQSQLQHTQVELQQSQSQLQHTQVELQQSQSQLQHTQVELQQSQSQLQHTQVELQQSQAIITGMESSKFWKLRNIWHKLKIMLTSFYLWGSKQHPHKKLNYSVSRKAVP